jgi:hypothetical protein
VHAADAPSADAAENPRVLLMQTVEGAEIGKSDEGHNEIWPGDALVTTTLSFDQFSNRPGQDEFV